MSNVKTTTVAPNDRTDDGIQQTIRAVTGIFVGLVVLMWLLTLLLHLLPLFIRAAVSASNTKGTGDGVEEEEDKDEALKRQRQQKRLQMDRRTRSCTGCYNKVSERQQHYRLLLRHCITVRRKRFGSTGLCRYSKPG